MMTTTEDLLVETKALIEREKAFDKLLKLDNARMLTGRFVHQVYSGKKNMCCCGCAGKHYPLGEPGFERMVKKIVGMISETKVKDLEFGGSYICLLVGDRQYLAYFEK